MTDLDHRQLALDIERQIQCLQQELQSPLETFGPAVPKLPVEEAKRLKRVVDDFRLFLWAYADSWSGAKSDTAATFQRIRLQAVADMLNLLRSDLAGKGVPDSPEGRAMRLAMENFVQTVR